jgi:hypothetical protein
VPIGSSVPVHDERIGIDRFDPYPHRSAADANANGQTLAAELCRYASDIDRLLRIGLREAQLGEVISAFGVQFLLTPEKRSAL